MAALNERYGEDFEFLNGFHETQLNFSDFIDGFIDKNVADVTIDANANASNKDIRSLLNEKGKSHDKLFAFNKIFYEMKKRYNLRTAKEWLETEYNGGFYLHDASTSTYLPYCYAYDLSRLATEGLFFLKNYNNQAPKHLTTFMDDVIEYISYMSNRSSGAVGIPNVLIWTYYFWKKTAKAVTSSKTQSITLNSASRSLSTALISRSCASTRLPLSMCPSLTVIISRLCLAAYSIRTAAMSLIVWKS